MPLPALNFQQKDFSGGQLTGTASRRDDSKLIRKGCREASNTRLLNTGPVENRFGRSVIGLDEGRTEVLRITGDLKVRLQFGDGTVVLREDESGDLLVSASSMPWDLDTLDQIKFGAVGRNIVITYPGSVPKQITLASADATMIDRTAGTIIYYPTGAGQVLNIANAFNGDTTESQATLGLGQHFMYRIGKDFGANPQVIGSAKLYGPTDDTIITQLDDDPNQLSGQSRTFELRASNTLPDFSGNANATTPDSTLIGTLTFNMSANDSSAHTISSSDLTTAYRYVWIETPGTNGFTQFTPAEVQFFSPTGAEQWTVDDFAFASVPAGGLAQPFFRFAPGNVTMTPGQTATGTGVTVSFSGNVLQSGHVGCYFRYAQKQLLCTAVSTPAQGTFTILETLPPTIPTTVASTTGFAPGMVVVGATSGAEGIVSSITSGTAMKIVMMTRYAGFVATESIVSSTGAITTVSSVSSAASPEAIAVWDEGVMSDLRGWPRSVTNDRERLIFADVPSVPNAVLESKIGVFNDFYTGADATDSLFELAPGNARVLHIVGGADQFVLTEDAAYYIPISAQNPLAPGFIEFRKIGAFGASEAAPVQLLEGVVFGASNGKAVIGILPTFSSGAPWQIRDISEYHSDLFTEPIALAVATGGAAASEQYLYILNRDGTAVVGRYDQANQFVGFVPYTSTPSLKWVSSFVDTVYFNVLNGTQWTVETADGSVWLDGAVFVNATSPALRPDPEDLTKGRLWFYAGLTVDLMKGSRYYGQRAIDSDGNITTQTGDDFSDADVVAGFKWTSRVSPLIPDEQEGTPRGQRMRRRRVKGATITVQDTTEFTWMGRTFAANPASSDPTPVSSTFIGRQAGRSYDPQIVFVKTKPGPFRIVEIDGEVTS